MSSPASWAAAESAAVTDWGPRILLTAAVVLVIILATWGMWRGWRARAASQASMPPPAPAPQRGRDLPGPGVAGRYVATTSAGDLLDRIVVHGLGHRGRAWLAITPEGVLITRRGEPDLWIPGASMSDVRLGSGQAQQAFEAGGLVLIEWQLGDRRVETGFRADDPQQHIETARELAALALSRGGPR